MSDRKPNPSSKDLENFKQEVLDHKMLMTYCISSGLAMLELMPQLVGFANKKDQERAAVTFMMSLFSVAKYEDIINYK